MLSRSVFIVLLMLLAGCRGGERHPEKQQQLQTQADVDQKLCGASVSKELINPETFQLFDFEQISKGDLPYKKSILEETFSTLSHFRQYQLRYKVDSKIGLKVTSIQRCDVYNDQHSREFCSCTAEL